MDGCMKQIAIWTTVIVVGSIIYANFASKITYDYISNQVAIKLARDLESKSITNVSVISFESMEGNNSLLGDYLSDNFLGKLLNNSSKINIIDRSKLNELLNEQELKISGLTDKDTVSKIGQLIGINGIVIGKYQVVNNWFSQDRITISVKVIDIESGRIIFSDEIETEYDDQLAGYKY
jgi:TolB-like protein